MVLNERLCPRYQKAAQLLGKRWTSLILKVLLDGPQHFSTIATQLEVISDRVLSERLKELIAEEIVHRIVYAESPVRIEYILTEKGKALSPLIEAIEQWSQQWLSLPVEESPCTSTISEYGPCSEIIAEASICLRIASDKNSVTTEPWKNGGEEV